MDKGICDRLLKLEKVVRFIRQKYILFAFIPLFFQIKYRMTLNFKSLWQINAKYRSERGSFCAFEGTKGFSSLKTFGNIPSFLPIFVDDSNQI